MTKVPFVCFKFSSMYIEQNAILKRGMWRTEKMTVWTFLSVLSNVFSKEKLVIEEHNVLLIYRAMKSSLWVFYGLMV